MKKYNSVFTIAVSIDHDNKDASDITMHDVEDAIVRRLENVMNDDPMETLADGPDDTTENEPSCPHCGGEGFVYSTHYADPYATTRRCECTERDPDEKYEQQNDK